MPKTYIAPETLEKIASELREDFLGDSSQDIEVDVFKIAEGLGCNVQLADFQPENVSARVVRVESLEKPYTIQVARNESPRRQKFSIAHEIAHIILHDDGTNEFVELRQPTSVYADEGLLYKEVQANMLASALLLPANQVRNIWASSKSIDDLAEIFNVSKSAAYFRLDNLGLLENE